MSSDPPNASPSPTPDEPGNDRELVERVRLLGAPLLEALESHSPGSGEHAEATGSYAYAAAVGIGLDRDTADLCRESAKLHDVGMIYVPAAVTGKPFDSWSAEERDVFDAHYDAGAKLARGAGIPDEICDWLLRIRERYDGHGAERLAGTAIPIAARVARAACACDTLLAAGGRAEPTPERRREAIERLRTGSGRELDPAVVDALVRVLETGAPA
jgi:HD-GYP domain-containing protein (c-di-GMP phosphodiesterase class II)